MIKNLSVHVSGCLKEILLYRICMIIIIGSLVSGNSLQAQSFTYFKYEMPAGANKTTYEGLLTILADGQSFARIKEASQPDEKPIIFELSLIDSMGEGTKSTRFLVTTENSDVITLTDTKLPNPPLFEFEATQTANGIIYSLSNMYVLQDKSWAAVSNLEKQEYAYADIPIGLVEDFYSTEDPIYEEYFSKPRVPDLIGRGLSSADRKRKIHLVMVIDLKDASMGESCSRDMDNITNTFTNLVKEMKMIPETPSITYLTNEKFNKSSVLKTLNGLKPGKNDIIIFYFSGHGFRIPGETRTELPRMVLSNRYTLEELEGISLSMQDVVDIIQKKPSAFNLVISDCCNVEFPLPRSDGQPPITTGKGIPSKIYSKNFEQLFLKPRGTLVFSSASPKQYSVGNPLLGGFFTWHFRVALSKYLSSPNSNVSWDNIFAEAAKNANWQAKSGLCPKESSTRCVQVPQKFSYLK